MSGDVFARQNIQNNLDWESALRNCFRGNITLSFETGKQHRMIISKAAIRALDNPTYVQLLMSMDDLTLLLIGTEYQGPDSLRVSNTGIDPLNRYRQLELARLIGRAGWKKGYRYTLDAIILPISSQAGLCFNMKRATVCLPMRNPA